MASRKQKNLSLLVKILFVALIFIAGSGAGFFYSHRIKPTQQTAETNKDIYWAFTAEVYNKIQENYWDKISDEQLVGLFVQGIEKLIGQPQTLKKNDRAHLEKLFIEINNQIEGKTKKKEFATKLADIVLANLKPTGRSRLYTKKEKKALSENVKNVNPETGQVEPTIDYKLLRPKIFYLHWKKFSPTTFDELKQVTEKFDDRQGLDTLILDLRDNVGGAIDGLPYFLGPFIGQDQYAYQFFHQGEKTDFKTKVGWLPSLVRYKKVVILINANTQSSAEVMTAVLKKYNVGVVLGTTTKGWGTVEKVFPLQNQLDQNEKYSVFLVHALTLREDGQPIEGNGVEPMININNPDWEDQLLAYFHYPELIEAVEEVL